ncbi:hypothetical protein CHL67_01895 [Prosthecochloris sp. GSB1]|uniref:O-antigen ligase family protein n=1 Tax=Prosthecochloris sp. GSB1 TaxID=281093 RepID=UPI000B8CD925|nr:O-antigen ligase family protein [Prosthecochloris sp. GSB1]ASQ89836.1 hypothetical protein CHL67_01895 [Prosthecochloris sp. GSB1]
MRRSRTIDFGDIVGAAVLVLVVVGYPLIAPFSAWFDIPNRTLSVPFRGLVAILSLALILRRAVITRHWTVNYFWFLWWLFWGFYVLRIFFDAWFYPEVLRLPLGEYLLYAVGVTFVPATALSFGISPQHLRPLLRWLFYVAFAAAFLNLSQLVLDSPQKGLSALFAGRKYTDTMNPIWLGHLGVTLMILGVCAFFSLRSTAYERPVFAAAVVFGGLMLIMSASKGPLLSFLVILPLFILLALRGMDRKAVLGVVGTGVLILFIGAYFSDTLMQSTFFHRLDQVFSGQSTGSVDKRLEMYIEGVELFFRNPLLGVGVEPLGFYPHNILLESFMTNGLPSGLMLFLMLVLSFYHAMKIVFRGGSEFWMPLLYLQYLVGAMFSGALYNSSMMWGLMAFLMGQKLCSDCNENRMGEEEHVR